MKSFLHWLALIVPASLIILSLFIYQQFFTQSANMEDFEQYYIDHSDEAIDGIRITFFGNTTLLIEDEVTQIMIDGFITRPSAFDVVFSDLETDIVRADEMIEAYGMENKLKAIFVAHTHYDHAMDASYFADRTAAVLHGSESTMNVGRGHRLDDALLSLLEGEEEVSIGDFTVTALPSLHSEPTPFNDDIGEVIETPLEQPAHALEYKEGGSFDFLISHEDRDILVKPSFNHTDGQYDGLDVDLLFLGITGYGKENEQTQDNFYRETVGSTSPSSVIPIHWDNFMRPPGAPLEAIFPLADNLSNGLTDLLERTEEDGVAFEIMDYESTYILE